MNKHKLEMMVNQGYSIGKISKLVNKSKGSVRHWLKMFGLKTKNKSFKEEPKPKKTILINGVECKKCAKCEEVKIVEMGFNTQSNGRVYSWCKECQKENMYKRQVKRKIECVNYKGGKCIVCGYNKYIGSLDFHHLDPNKKEFNIARLKGYSLDKLSKELDKCVLLCKNCHSETHHGLIDLQKYLNIE
jgi:hypothetical protein